MTCKQPAGKISQQAYSSYMSGQLREAAAQFAQALQAAREEKNELVVWTSLVMLGEIYKVIGDLDAAEKYLVDALKRTDGAGVSPQQKAVAVHQLGEVLRKKGLPAKAGSFYKQSIEIIGETPSHPLYTVARDNLASIYYQAGDFDDAARLIDAAIKAMDSTGRQQGTADLLRKLGLCYRSKGDLDKAIAFFDQSYTAAISRNDLETAVDVLMKKGSTYAKKPDFASAIKTYRDALSLQKSGNITEYQSKVYRALLIALLKSGQYSEALELLDAGGGAGDDPHASDWDRVYRAVCYAATGRVDEAIAILESVLIKARRDSNETLESYCLGNLGFAYKQKGELALARDFFQQSLRLHQKLGDSTGEFYDHVNWLSITRSLDNNKSDMISDSEHVHYQQIEEAAIAMPDAEYRFRAMAAKAESEGNSKLQTFALNALGIIAKNSGSLEKAVGIYRKSLSIDGLGALEKSLLLNNLGTIYGMLQNYDEAFGCFRESIRVVNENFGPNSPLELMPLVNLANLYLKIGRIDLAESVYFTRQLRLDNILDRRIDLELRIRILDAKGDKNRLISALFEMAKVCHEAGMVLQEATSFEHLGNIYSSDPISSPDQALLCYNNAIHLLARTDFQEKRMQIHYRRAYARFILGQISEAYDDLSLAIKWFEKRQVLLTSDVYRRTQRSEVLSWYDLMIKVCIRRGLINEAIEYVERIRAQNLVVLMATRDISPGRIVPEVVSERFRKTLSEHRQLDLKLSQMVEASPASPDLQQLRTQLDQKIAELNAAIDEIAAHDQSFPNIFRTEPIQYKDIEKMIPRDRPSAIVEFYVGPPSTLVFIIAPEVPPVAFELDIGEEKLYSLLHDRWFFPYGRSVGDDWRENMAATLSDVYDELFAKKALNGMSIENYLHEHGIQRILLIPHNLLHIIPFHAIRYHRDGRLRYLFEDYEISYAPSCQLLQRCLSKSIDHHERFAAFVDPVATLPFATAEAEIISRLFTETLLCQGEKATLGSVYRELPGADVVHFSCDCTFNPASPLDSQMTLADGFLSLGTLYERCHTRPGSLVSLAACESGLIRPNLTDDFVSFPNGFLFAGASCVLNSLWRVNDLSTCLLMARFYQNYRRGGLSIAASLRSAQDWVRTASIDDIKGVMPREYWDVLNELSSLNPGLKHPFEHPFYWAAFQVTGASWQKDL